jgi:hypothetical protein
MLQSELHQGEEDRSVVEGNGARGFHRSREVNGTASSLALLPPPAL